MSERHTQTRTTWSKKRWCEPAASVDLPARAGITPHLAGRGAAEPSATSSRAASWPALGRHLLDQLDAAQPAPRTCGANTVELKGADLTSLAKRQVRNGTIAGFANIRGIYRHGVVTVTHQAAPGGKPKQVTDSLPCSVAPVSSLSRAIRQRLSGEGPDLAITGYSRAHPGVVVDFGLLRTSAKVTVAYVLATGDLAAVRAALLPAYGKALCVNRSHYTRSQVLHALAFMNAFRGPGHEGGNEGIGPDGQDVVQIRVVSVTPSLARKASTFPDGLVKLEPWLRPVRS